jgi:hypothetical protein
MSLNKSRAIKNTKTAVPDNGAGIKWPLVAYRGDGKPVLRDSGQIRVDGSGSEPLEQSL